MISRARIIAGRYNSRDNFNAGIVCALVADGISRNDLAALPEEKWDSLIATATQFAQEVCGTTDNYISVANTLDELTALLAQC